MMELFYSSGLRLGELVGLDLGAIDFGDRMV
jgi:site-specific recombinase XerC